MTLRIYYEHLRCIRRFGITPPWVLFTIFKLYKWYQIAQRTFLLLLKTYHSLMQEYLSIPVSKWFQKQNQCKAVPSSFDITTFSNLTSLVRLFAFLLLFPSHIHSHFVYLHLFSKSSPKVLLFFITVSLYRYSTESNLVISPTMFSVNSYIVQDSSPTFSLSPLTISSCILYSKSCNVYNLSRYLLNVFEAQ